MALPPGPVYLLRLLPSFVIPSLAVYIFLRFLEATHDIIFPKCLAIPAITLAKPILFFATRYYWKLKDRRNASAKNAILVPYVQNSVYSTIVKLVESIRSGYPGESHSSRILQTGAEFMAKPIPCKNGLKNTGALSSSTY